jgi:hypothetical protein
MEDLDYKQSRIQEDYDKANKGAEYNGPDAEEVSVGPEWKTALRGTKAYRELAKMKQGKKHTHNLEIFISYRVVQPLIANIPSETECLVGDYIHYHSSANLKQQLTDKWL